MPSWVSYDVLTFIVFLALVVGTAFFGGQWGANAWYRSLSKPSWTPPNWLFPIAWLVLYTMIAIAGWQVWTTEHPGRMVPLTFWAMQLIFNAFWSYFFFGRKEMGVALADLIALWVTIAGFIVTAWPIHQTAAILFVPYLAWVSFAGALNTSILMRNPRGAQQLQQVEH